MITFFKRVREKLVGESNGKRYLIYAIGEILLVVIGILIALQINNWNEANNREQLKNQLLIQLIIELSEDYKSFESKLNDNQKIYDRYKYLLKLKENDQQVLFTGSELINIIGQEGDSALYEVSRSIQGYQNKQLAEVHTDTIKAHIETVYYISNLYFKTNLAVNLVDVGNTGSSSFDIRTNGAAFNNLVSRNLLTGEDTNNPLYKILLEYYSRSSLSQIETKELEIRLRYSFLLSNHFSTEQLNFFLFQQINPISIFDYKLESPFIKNLEGSLNRYYENIEVDSSELISSLLYLNSQKSKLLLSKYQELHILKNIIADEYGIITTFGGNTVFDTKNGQTYFIDNSQY